LYRVACISIWVPGYNSSASVIFLIFHNNFKKTQFSINLITISGSDPPSILGFLRMDAASILRILRTDAASEWDQKVIKINVFFG